MRRYRARVRPDRRRERQRPRGTRTFGADAHGRVEGRLGRRGAEHVNSVEAGLGGNPPGSRQPTGRSARSSSAAPAPSAPAGRSPSASAACGCVAPRTIFSWFATAGAGSPPRRRRRSSRSSGFRLAIRRLPGTSGWRIPARSHASRLWIKRIVGESSSQKHNQQSGAGFISSSID